MRQVRSPIPLPRRCLLGCSSSLQRIEATNVRLERRFSEIGDLIQNLVTSVNQGGSGSGSGSGGGGGGGNATGTSSGHPTLTVVDAKTSKILILQLNAALMKNAEVGQRKWSSIGVDEWIQAGRWWLMKVCIHRLGFPNVTLISPLCLAGSDGPHGKRRNRHFSTRLCRPNQGILDFDRRYRPASAAEHARLRGPV